jgi:hypothetical protein
MLTNGFSKKNENHAHQVALHFMYYNFVRIHSALRMTPAMAAGESDRLWEIGDIVALVDCGPGPRVASADGTCLCRDNVLLFAMRECPNFVHLASARLHCARARHGRTLAKQGEDASALVSGQSVHTDCYA